MRNASHLRANQPLGAASLNRRSTHSLAQDDVTVANSDVIEEGAAPLRDQSQFWIHKNALRGTLDLPTTQPMGTAPTAPPVLTRHVPVEGEAMQHLDDAVVRVDGVGAPVGEQRRVRAHRRRVREPGHRDTGTCTRTDVEHFIPSPGPSQTAQRS